MTATVSVRPTLASPAAHGARDAGGGAVVYLAGSGWDEVGGTDRKLVTALAERVDVLWVDPPVSVLRWRARRRRRTTDVPGVERLRTVGPPGLTRPVMRPLSRLLVGRRVARRLAAMEPPPRAVISAAPHGLLGRLDAERSIYFATDDFLAGADLMGMSRSAQRRAQDHDVDAADLVMVVSPALQADFADRRPVVVVPNGCTVRTSAPPPLPSSRSAERLPFDGPVVGLMGQLNERLDVGVLQRLTAAGVPVLVVGPLTARDRDARQRLLAWLYRDGVHWVGERPADQLAHYLAKMSVGITPYRDTEFNRRSFPLKTLDYLAAGVPVVTTPLPATAWLDTPYAIQAAPEDFVRAVKGLLAPSDARGAAERMAFAVRHDWSSRAEQVYRLCSDNSIPIVE